jgi:hypothetical protein
MHRLIPYSQLRIYRGGHLELAADTERRCRGVPQCRPHREQFTDEGWSHLITVRRFVERLLKGPDAAGRPSLAWVTAIQAVDPRFEFTDPPFLHSLTMTMTLALAAAGNRPAAVLTGPAIAARS